MKYEDRTYHLTMRDVAKAAGVSIATVSRALRHNKTVNPGTANHVLEIANKLNYYPNFQAKSLRLKRTNSIGIIFNNLGNPFFTEILSEITMVLNKTDYFMIVCDSNYSIESERKNIISMISKGVDGIIISPIDPGGENIKLLLNNQIETVFIDCLPYFSDQCYVYTDQKQGIRLSIEYLVKNGHKNILLFTCPQEKNMTDLFKSTYLELSHKYGFKIEREFFIESDEFTIDSGYKVFKKLLTQDISDKNVGFTSIATMNDLLAIGIYKAANELGIDIPGNYSILGYDDIEITSVLKPPLTTVHQSRKRIGIESVTKLLHNINSQEKDRENVVFRPYIVVRGSVRSIH